jgi:hypothetical protein
MMKRMECSCDLHMVMVGLDCSVTESHNVTVEPCEYGTVMQRKDYIASRIIKLRGLGRQAKLNSWWVHMLRFIATFHGLDIDRILQSPTIRTSERSNHL